MQSSIKIIPLLLFAILAYLPAGQAQADLINHKVKITNDLKDSSVTVFLNYGNKNDHYKEFTINPQSSHTFETGLKCPRMLSGFVQSYHVTMIDRCTGGRELTSECLHTCWSSSWIIKRRDDGAFHFNKD